MKNKIYFITYGDDNFDIAKKHIIALAKYSGFFEESLSFNREDLDYEFKNKYEEILNMPRGGGYWIWKHRIIQNLLKEISENDLIIYCDAGASLNFKASKRFNEYIEMINSSKYGNFRMKCEQQFKEVNYTTKELFNYFKLNTDSEFAKTTQLQAGHMIFKKNKHSRELLEHYSALLEKDSNLITDYYSSFSQHKKFIENRHDQSIFSLLSKIYGCELIDNETEFKHRPSEQYNYPFLSVRTYGHGIRDRVDFLFNKKKYSKKIVYF